MKKIELTDLQNSKLTEMCEMLFPEYTIYGIQKANHFGRIVNLVQGNKWESDDDDQYPVDEFFIHWFEFCCNTLVNKLFDNSFDFGKIYYEILKSDNPIDYLYEQFKQLK